MHEDHHSHTVALQVAGTPWGETPLMVAGASRLVLVSPPSASTNSPPALPLSSPPVQFGHERAGRLLAGAGHLEERNEHGQTALHIAGMFGKDACCLALIQAGAQLDARDSDDVRSQMRISPCALC